MLEVSEKLEALSRQLSLQVWSDVAASLHHEAAGAASGSRALRFSV